MEIASAYPDRVVSVREVSEQQAISAKYLEQILRPLRAAGFVRSARGKQGGFVLGRPPETITLKDVIECLDGPLTPVDCVNCADACAMHEVCPTRDTWVELKEAIETVLERTTIRDLVERRKRKAISPLPM
jgi:Rrf2 family transcriptional regulator, cysteine metabolism repressor